jgi:hypothetical protein
MMPEGRVIVEFPCLPGGAVTVAFHQPGDIARLLSGKTPEAALRIVPALFSVCGIAQAHAAVLAFEAALGVSASPRTLAARAALTGMESLRENALRIALDWPRFLGREPSGARMRPVMQCPPRLSEALFGQLDAFEIGREARPDAQAADTVIAEAEALLTEQIFAEPLAVWLSRRGMAGLRDWAKSSPAIAAQLVAYIDAMGWFGEAGADMTERSERPSQPGDGAPAAFAALDAAPESSVFTRRAGDPLIASLGAPGLGARMAARLAELARLPGEISGLIAGRIDAPSDAYTDDGYGVGVVAAARGALAHAVKLRNGVIADYRILPPTSLNFAADGAAARCLSRLCAEDRAAREKLANLVVNAIDPCVAYEVRMR